MEPFDPTNHQFESDPTDKEKCLHCGCVRGAHTQPEPENPNTETAVATCPSCAMTPAVQPPPQNIEVTAKNPDEMAHAQNALIAWAENKVAEVKAEYHETKESYEIALKNKWRASPLERAATKAKHRLTFYQKILAALRAGFVIIPNFPATVFAIRTDKHKPLKMITTSTSRYHDKLQKSEILPVGEGEYQNPFPVVYEKKVEAGNPASQTYEGKQDKYKAWADAWKDLVFPLTMAKPRIMEAVSRAMALKIFDDLCLFEEGKGDPIIVARIYNKSRPIYGHFPEITFMVAWHLNTRDI